MTMNQSAPAGRRSRTAAHGPCRAGLVVALEHLHALGAGHGQRWSPSLKLSATTTMRVKASPAASGAQAAQRAQQPGGFVVRGHQHPPRAARRRRTAGVRCGAPAARRRRSGRPGRRRRGPARVRATLPTVFIPHFSFLAKIRSGVAEARWAASDRTSLQVATPSELSQLVNPTGPRAGPLRKVRKTAPPAGRKRGATSKAAVQRKKGFSGASALRESGAHARPCSSGWAARAGCRRRGTSARHAACASAPAARREGRACADHLGRHAAHDTARPARRA